MKFIKMIIVLLILVLVVLSGCTSAEPQTTENPYPGPAAKTGTQSAPEPYPDPQEPVEALSIPYPDLADGAELEWAFAVPTILRGEVTKVVQTQDTKVLITFKDGRTLITFQPEKGTAAYLRFLGEGGGRRDSSGQDDSKPSRGPVDKLRLQGDHHHRRVD